MAGKWNPAHHPRDKRGRFTKSATRVMTPGEKKKATALAGSFKGSDQGPGPGSGAAKRPLTGDQSSALDGYLGGGFKDTNRNLRAGNGAADPAVEHLDAAMQNLPADVVVTRRVSLGMFGGVPIDQLAGTKVRDAGYTSASLTELPGDGPTVHMRIQVPAGTKGIPVPGSSSGEILLDRDVEFAVLGASKRGDGGYDMTMIALPKKGSTPASQPKGDGSDEPAKPQHTAAQAADFARWREQTSKPGTREVPAATQRQKHLKMLQTKLDTAIVERDRLLAEATAKYKRKRSMSAAEKADQVRQATWQAEATVTSYRDNIDRTKNLPENLDTYDKVEGVARVPAQTLNSDQPLAVYGDMLHLHDESESTHHNLTDLEKAPAIVHAAVSEHLAEPGKTGGIYVGDSMIPDLDDLGSLRSERPRGWSEGQTFDRVPGVYSPNERVIAIGHAHQGHGSQSVALHEFGHGADDAIGRTLGFAGPASEGGNWVDIHSQMGGSPYPYFTQPGSAGRSEAWAEAFTAWASAKSSGKDPAGEIAWALGGKTNSKAGIDAVSAGRMATYFDQLVQRLERRGS